MMVPMNNYKNKGFTLIELMLVLVIISVLYVAYAQTLVEEANQLSARKLGTQELYVYNNAVQKYLSANASVDPVTITGTNNGVNWLKSTACPSGLGTANDSYLDCNFLSGTGGLTTVGQMSFTTEITYNAAPVGVEPKGLNARTVLSRMATLAPGETGAGTLGLASMVASAAFLAPDPGANNDPGTVIYCPNLTPFPAPLAPYCGAERDQVVMFGHNDRTNDTWLRVDHGNVMRDVLEAKSPGSTTMDPSSDTDIDNIDSRNRRHLRNFSRIYNLGPTGDNAGNENLILGKRLGNAIAPTLADSGVIIDADMEIFGNLIVDGDITASGNAVVSGTVQSTQFLDLDDATNTFLLDPDQISTLNEVVSNNIEAINTDLALTTDNLNITKKGAPGDVIVNGAIDVSNLQVRKNGTLYNLDDLLPNLTLIGSVKLRHNQTVAASAIETQCGGTANTKVYIQPLVDEVVVHENVGAQVRYIDRLTGPIRYRYRAMNPYRTTGSKEATNAEAIIAFYCER